VTASAYTEHLISTRWVSSTDWIPEIQQQQQRQQESRATTKMTVRCALYMGAPKIFKSPWVHPRLPLPKFLTGFCSNWSCEYAYKFEVRNFTHSWDNRGTQKNLGSPWICSHSLFSQIFHRLLFGWTLWMYRPNLKFVALAVPEITATAILGWSCEPPI